MTRWLMRSALAAAALGLAWRILVVGMAEWYVDQDTQHGAHAALTWYPQHPDAVWHAAEQLIDRDPAHAEALLHEALRADPSDGQTLLDLAQLWRTQDRHERAGRALELAGQLAPAEAEVHEQAADYWLERGDLQRAAEQWDLALRIEPERGKYLFPVLLRLAADPEGKTALRASTSELPEWWPPFFIYATKNVARVDTLRALFVLRQSASEPLSDAERNAFVARLQHEGLWAEAYLMWLNTLDAKQLRVAGYLYDGGFELGLFEEGFDWQVPERDAVVVETGLTYAMKGHKALHMVFQARPVQGPIIEQLLFLPSGRYRLSGRVRPEKLQSANGLEWILSCAAGDDQILASSERFLGADEWRGFIVDFTVPAANCAGQRLHLQVAGRHPHDRMATGEIWFDGLAIKARLDRSLPERAERKLQEVEGTVLVNQGKEYRLGHSGMPLQPNARVVVMDGSSAVVTGARGSVTQLKSNSLFDLGRRAVEH